MTLSVGESHPKQPERPLINLGLPAHSCKSIPLSHNLQFHAAMTLLGLTCRENKTENPQSKEKKASATIKRKLQRIVLLVSVLLCTNDPGLEVLRKKQKNSGCVLGPQPHCWRYCLHISVVSVFISATY